MQPLALYMHSVQVHLHTAESCSIVSHPADLPAAVGEAVLSAFDLMDHRQNVTTGTYVQYICINYLCYFIYAFDVRTLHMSEVVADWTHCSSTYICKPWGRSTAMIEPSFHFIAANMGVVGFPL